MRRAHPLNRRLISALLALLISAPAAAFAQDTVSKPPVSPGRAFMMSALAPGLGQAALNRGSGLIFVTIEAIGLVMYGKSKHDLSVARGFARDSTPLAYTIDPSTGAAQRDSAGALQVAQWSPNAFGDDRIHARRTHVEDWVAFLIFNHLFAGIDAYVAAHLWRLPAQVQMRVTPGGAGIQGRVRW